MNFGGILPVVWVCVFEINILVDFLNLYLLKLYGFPILHEGSKKGRGNLRLWVHL